jgi:thymine-DNA glycosylase
METPTLPHSLTHHSHSDPEVTQLLIDRGANLEAPQSKNTGEVAPTTPLLHSMESPQVARVLVRNGARLSVVHPLSGKDPLCMAIEVFGDEDSGPPNDDVHAHERGYVAYLIQQLHRQQAVSQPTPTPSPMCTLTAVASETGREVGTRPTIDTHTDVHTTTSCTGARTVTDPGAQGVSVAALGAMAASFASAHLRREAGRIATDRLNSVSPVSGRAALHRAVAAGYLQNVRALLSAGASVRVRDSAGQTPLHLAAFADIVSALLQAGANPHLGTAADPLDTPLRRALAAQKRALVERMQAVPDAQRPPVLDASACEAATLSQKRGFTESTVDYHAVMSRSASSAHRSLNPSASFSSAPSSSSSSSKKKKKRKRIRTGEGSEFEWEPSLRNEDEREDRRLAQADHQEQGSDHQEQTSTSSTTSTASTSTIASTSTPSAGSVATLNARAQAALAEVLTPLDSLRPGLDLVVCGINPGTETAKHGHHYAGRNNHFWPLLHLSGIVGAPLTHTHDRALLDDGIGFTNLCARVTRSSSALRAADYRLGAAQLRTKLSVLRPHIVCFNGKGIYERFQGTRISELGEQLPLRFGEHTVHVFVMPSTSGRVANYQKKEKLDFFRQLKQLLTRVRHLRG